MITSAKITGRKAYDEEREAKIVASLVFSNFNATTNRNVTKALDYKAFSPKRQELVYHLAKRAKEGYSLTLEHLSGLCPDSLLPTEFADRWADPREIASAIASVNAGKWVASAQASFAKVQEAFTTSEATNEGAAALLKAGRKMVAELEAHVNGNTVQVVRAFTPDRIDALLSKERRTMYPTGIASIDELLGGGAAGGGVQAKRMLLLSSNAKGAKTTMACSMAAFMIQTHIPVKYITLEVPAEDIERRIASKLTRTVHRDLWTKNVPWTSADQQEWRNTLIGMGLPQYLQIIDGSSALTAPDRIIEEVESMHNGVVFVDHVGLVDDSGSKDANYRFRVKLMEDLHRAIQKHNAALVTVAQLNDEGKLAAAKQQNQSVDYHLTWMLGDIEHEKKICCITPKDFRIPVDLKPLYFRLEFDYQSFVPLSEDSAEVLAYVEEKGAPKGARNKSSWTMRGGEEAL